jgi:antitoxin (DNA-binding transcriptional repressor) of toxin-antitoxin stability system
MTVFPVNQHSDDLNHLLDRVERGEDITLMRDGTIVASLVKSPDKSKGEKAAARILQRRIGLRLSHDDVKDLIADGRR